MSPNRGVCWYDAEAAAHRSEASYGILDPSQPQNPYHLDAELALDESHTLLFASFNGTPIVQVVRRQPQPTNPRTHEPSGIAPFLWLGLIARAVRAGYCVVKGILLSFGGRYRYPARFLFQRLHQPSHSIRSKAYQTHLEHATGLTDRLIYRRLPKL